MFYRTKIYDSSKKDSLDYIICKSMDNVKIPESDIFPCHKNEIGKKVYLSYPWFYQNEWYSNIIHQSQIDYENNLNDKQTKYGIFSKSNVYYSITPNNLFPCKNYTELTNTIRNFVKVCSINKQYSPIGILIDGEPGLGKSKFADYIASTSILSYVYKVDMTICIGETDFSKLFESIFHRIKVYEPSLFVLDELDKYLNHAIMTKYSQHKKEQISKNLPITKFKTFKQELCTNFLFDILHILERDNLEDACIIIFAANNFNTIFEDVDQKHFASLKSRFLKFHFERCDRDQLIKYLQFYNQKFMNTQFYCNNLDSLIMTLNTNISITYRRLSHISILCNYQISKIIEMINNNTEELQSSYKEESLNFSESDDEYIIKYSNSPQLNKSNKEIIKEESNDKYQSNIEEKYKNIEDVTDKCRDVIGYNSDEEEPKEIDTLIDDNHENIAPLVYQ